MKSTGIHQKNDLYNLRLVLIFMSILCHTLAFVQFQLLRANLNTPEQFGVQFLFLLVVILAMSLLLHVVTKKITIFLILLFRFTLIIILGLPLDVHLEIEFTIFFVFILDLFFFLPTNYALLFSVCSIVLLALAQKPIVSWGNETSPPLPHTLIYYASFSVILCILSAFIKIMSVNLTMNQEITNKIDRASSELVETNMKLQEYAASTEEKATISERKRLAREIHDTLAYTLTNLIMMMEAAIDLSPQNNKQLTNHLMLARDQAKNGLVDVKRAIEAMRSTTERSIRGIDAIFHLVKSFEKATQLKIELNIRELPKQFGNELDFILYRIVQEGITNAIRHGNATYIRIHLELVDKRILVNVNDNGIGFANIKEGFGITGMRERIEKRNGELSISSKPRIGTHLQVSIPVESN